jgi:hypothetical protein
MKNSTYNSLFLDSEFNPSKGRSFLDDSLEGYEFLGDSEVEKILLSDLEFLPTPQENLTALNNFLINLKKLNLERTDPQIIHKICNKVQSNILIMTSTLDLDTDKDDSLEKKIKEINDKISEFTIQDLNVFSTSNYQKELSLIPKSNESLRSENIPFSRDITPDPSRTIRNTNALSPEAKALSPRPMESTNELSRHPSPEERKFNRQKMGFGNRSSYLSDFLNKADQKELTPVLEGYEVANTPRGQIATPRTFIALHDELSRANTKIIEQSSEIKLLEQKLFEKNQQLSQSITDLKLEKVRNLEFQDSQIAFLDEQNKYQSDFIKALEARNSKLESNKTDLLTTIEDQNSEILFYHATNAELRSRIASFNSQIDELQKNLSQEKLKSLSLEQEYQEISEKSQYEIDEFSLNVNQEILQLRTELNDLKKSAIDKSDRIFNEYDQHEEQIVNLNYQITELKKSHQHQIARLENDKLQLFRRLEARGIEVDFSEENKGQIFESPKSSPSQMFRENLDFITQRLPLEIPPNSPKNLSLESPRGFSFSMETSAHLGDISSTSQSVLGPIIGGYEIRQIDGLTAIPDSNQTQEIFISNPPTTNRLITAELVFPTQDQLSSESVLDNSHDSDSRNNSPALDDPSPTPRNKGSCFNFTRICGKKSQKNALGSDDF